MKKKYLAAALAAALMAGSASAAGGGTIGFNFGISFGYTCSKNPPACQGAPGCGGCLHPYGWSPHYAPPAMYSALGQGVGYSPWVMPQAPPHYGYDYGYPGYGHAGYGHAPVILGQNAMPRAVVPGKVIEQAPAPKEINNTPPKKGK